MIADCLFIGIFRTASRDVLRIKEECNRISKPDDPDPRDNLVMTTKWTTRPVRAEDAGIIARHRYSDAGPKEDLNAYERWRTTRIDRGAYTGVLAELDDGVIAGAGAVVLD